MTIWTRLSAFNGKHGVAAPTGCAESQAVKETLMDLWRGTGAKKRLMIEFGLAQRP